MVRSTYNSYLAPTLTSLQAASLNAAPGSTSQPEVSSPLVTLATNLSGPVLVFDSGVGGLSIVRSLRQLELNLPLVYACDNAAFPYGEKNAAWLQTRIVQVLGQLINQVQPSLVILACNTASTLALDELRHKFALPFVGVVPAIKPAAALSRSGTLGLLATCGTLGRPYTQQLIQEFAPNCRIIKVGSQRLVELAEAFMAGANIHPDELLAILAPFLNEPSLDTVILGCTHFPLLQQQLAQTALAAGAQPWHWVDSGAAIARRVTQLLATSSWSITPRFDASCWLTSALPANSLLPKALQDFGFQRLQILPLN